MTEKLRRKFTKEFKMQMVNLAETGKAKSDIVIEYELTYSMLNRWLREYKTNGSFKAAATRSPEENELIKLRKENKQLKMENDILKQAALIIGRK